MFKHLLFALLLCLPRMAPAQTLVDTSLGNSAALERVFSIKGEAQLRCEVHKVSGIIEGDIILQASRDRRGWVDYSFFVLNQNLPLYLSDLKGYPYYRLRIVTKGTHATRFKIGIKERKR